MRSPVSSSRKRALFTALVLAASTAGCASSRGGESRPEDVTPLEGEKSRVEVGYGSSTKRDLTSAVGSVTSCDVAGQRVTRIEDMLAGRVAGVEVSRNRSGTLSVRVRGTQSLYSDEEPLYVVDGMPLLSGGPLTGMNPQDVERIDVLKDAGATAIYGSRGANGVIVITTKRGLHRDDAKRCG